MNAPRRFALTREIGDSNQVIGYGMVLPDGSTYSVGWPTRGTAFYSSESAEQCADIRCADIVWIDEVP